MNTCRAAILIGILFALFMVSSAAVADPASTNASSPAVDAIGGGVGGLCPTGNFKCSCCKSCEINFEICLTGCEVRFGLPVYTETCVGNCFWYQDNCEAGCGGGCWEYQTQ